MQENGVHIHNFKDTIVPPTCNQKGYTLHKCDCGYEYKDSFVPEGKHDFVLLDETPATCTKNGVRRLRCTRCGAIRSFDITGHHEWSDWSVKTAATCTEDGVKIRFCKKCGQTEEQPIKATGHKLTPTGKSKREYFCQNCGEIIKMPSKVKKTILKLCFGVLLPIVLVVAIVFSTVNYFIPNYHYTTALEAIEEGDYYTAYYALKDCVDYKDSKELLKKFEITYGIEEITYYGDYGEETGKTRYERNKHGDQILYEHFNEKGKLTSKTETQYKYNKKGNATIRVNRYSDGNQNKTEYTYDKKGNCILAIQYDRYGNQSWTDEYTYDKDGNELSYAHYGDLGEYVRGHESTYDKDGNQLTYISYNEKKEVDYKYEYEYEYDKNDNMTQKTCYYFSSNTKSTDKYKYNKNGDVEEIITYDSNDKITRKTEFKYNDNGDLEKRMHVQYNDGKKTEYEYKYRYDNNGNLTQVIRYVDGERSSYYEKYEYDDDGNMISVKYCSDSLKYDYEYKYDDDGIIIETIVYDDGEKIQKYEYSAPIILYNPDYEETVINMPW